MFDWSGGGLTATDAICRAHQTSSWNRIAWSSSYTVAFGIGIQGAVTRHFHVQMQARGGKVELNRKRDLGRPLHSAAPGSRYTWCGNVKPAPGKYFIEGYGGSRVPQKNDGRRRHQCTT